MNATIWIASRLSLFGVGLYFGIEQAQRQNWLGLVATAAVTAVAMTCPCRFAIVRR